MLPLWYAFGALGDLLEVVLLWRIQRARLWRRYPFFSVFCVYVVSSTVVQSVLLEWHGFRSHVYATFYWASGIVGISLSSLVVWEVLRHSFRRRSSLCAVVGTVSLLLAAAMTGLLFVARGNPVLPRSMGYFALDFGRYASLVMAPVVLWLIAAARYYRIPLGRNIWGMAVGLGIFLSLSAVNAAAYLLGRPSQALSLVTFPAGFVSMLAIWTWALWRYAPNPQCAPALAEYSELDLILWRQEWHRLLTSMRKAFER